MSRRLTPPLGLAGMLPLILVVELLISRGDVRWMTPDQWYARETVRSAETIAPGRDFLVLGDSLAKLAVPPRRIEAETGLRGYNLAVSGSQASNSYYMLKRAIDSGARPRFVLVDFFPPLQRLSPWHVIEIDPFLLTYRDALELAWNAGDASFLASVATRKLLPSVARREAIRTVATAHVKKTFERNWAAYAHPVLMNQKSNDGAQIHPDGKPDRKDVARLNSELFPAWTVDPMQERYMRRLIESADAIGARVVWILPPYMPELHRRTVDSGFDAAWTRYIDGFRRDYPRLSVFDARTSVFPEDSFMDPNHLARSGSASFATDLAGLLKGLDSDRAGAGRMVAAGPFRVVARPDGLEDLTESGDRIRRVAREKAAARVRR